MKTLDEATARRLVVGTSDFGPIPPGDVESAVQRGRRRWLMRRTVQALGAVALVTVIAGGALKVIADNGDQAPIALGGEQGDVQGPDLVDRLDSDDTSMSCVSEFSAETLQERTFAFDGTVVAARPQRDPRAPERNMNRVQFKVHEWFTGGVDPTATIWVPANLLPGDRLLVSGEPRWGGAPLDDAIAWLGCGGFTTPYSEETAQFWRDATG